LALGLTYLAVVIGIVVEGLVGQRLLYARPLETWRIVLVIGGIAILATGVYLETFHSGVWPARSGSRKWWGWLALSGLIAVSGLAFRRVNENHQRDLAAALESDS
jgi:hypothetical protein